jgi:solute carrier family 35 protein
LLHLTEKVKDVTSVGLIVLGAFIAGARDLSFDFYGYAVVFAFYNGYISGNHKPYW